MSLILTTTLLCVISLPSSTVALPKKPGPKPSKIAVSHHHQKGYGRLGDSRVGWARSSLSDPKAPSSPSVLLSWLPNIPGLPNIPEIPNIPMIPNVPGLPNIPQIPNIPKIPSIPGIPNIPRIPNVPGLPNIPDIPNIPRIPNIPEIPNIPRIPNIRVLPNIPEIPNILKIPGIPNITGPPSLPRLTPLPPFQLVVLLQSAKMEKCLTKDVSKTAEKCFSHIFSSWAEKDFKLDKVCCEIVAEMDMKCNSHVRMLFKSHLFAPLLQYSCHI